MATLSEENGRSRSDAETYMMQQLADSDTSHHITGEIACLPSYDGHTSIQFQGVDGAQPKCTSLIMMHRLWLRFNDERPSDSPTLQVVLSEKTSAFDDPDKVTGGQTDTAKYIESFLSMFGPEGSVNSALAASLPAMLAAVKKKMPVIKNDSTGTDEDRFKKIAADAAKGFVSGRGKSPEYMPKQLVKLWTSTRVNKDTGSEESVTYAQLTLEVKKLFVPVESPKTDEEQAAHCALFAAGSDLRRWQTQNPDMQPNLDAVRINCAEPGSTRSTWVDLVASMHDASRCKEVWVQTHSRPWKTYLLPERKRIVHSHFLNELDVYAVVTSESTTAEKPLLNAKQLARSNATRAASSDLQPFSVKKPRVDA